MDSNISAESSGDVLKADKKGIWGWMLFDFAAQPFFTVVTTFIFAPYVTKRMVEDSVAGQSSWAFSIAIAGIFIGILSPILGSIADTGGSRKSWIGFFAIIKILALSLLWFSAPGSELIWVLTLFIIATVAAEFSIIFNDSMMPYIIKPEDTGRVSNIAWGLGYLGGMLVLIVILMFLAGGVDTGKTLIGLDPLFGLDPKMGEDARVAAPLSAVWYFIFILPMFLFTPDKKLGALSVIASVKNGFSLLKNTLYQTRQRVGLFRFFVARMIYQDGVTALLGLGGIFAAGMFNWETLELGIFGILLNVVAIPSCLIAGRLDSKIGSRIVVLSSVFILIIATIGIVSTGPGFALFGLVQLADTTSTGLFSTTAEKIYIGFSFLIGIAFGPVQASSRSYLAQSIMPFESGRYFGLYSFVGRATSFLAPLAVAAVTYLTDSTRLGMSIILLFFVIGFIIMYGAPRPEKNMEDAKRYQQANA